MLLTDISVKRPVFASVISLILVAFGIVAFTKLPLRQYPDINPPVVSIETIYRGAAAPIVETRITQLVEDAVSGIEGIKLIQSISEDGSSRVSIEFNLTRNVDDAANDVRDRVSRITSDLPDEAEPPEIFKVDSNTDVIMWINYAGDTMSQLELTDYAQRELVDRLSVIDGVAQVRVGGGRAYAMRVWLDYAKMQARNITVSDIENALRNENIELPAGRIESRTREYTFRLERDYGTPEDFDALPIKRSESGAIIRLGDVAYIRIGAEDERSELRGNGQDMVGLGIIKQSTANTLEVANRVKAEIERLRPNLPEGTDFYQSYDSSLFIEASIHEVYVTLGIAMVMVIIVIYLFLGTFRATLIPAVTVPVSLISSFIFLYALGYSLNLLTLLALVLAIGLVVDDSIIMLENIQRRINEGERRLSAAYLGARQVGFAVIATTLVLVAVFIPITFLEGNIGRLFTEFAFAMIAAVIFSSIVALTLSPMLCSKILQRGEVNTPMLRFMNNIFSRIDHRYSCGLDASIKHKGLVVGGFILMLGAMVAVAQFVPREFVPKEDQGRFIIRFNAPEGSSFEYTQQYARKLEDDLLPYVGKGEIQRILVRVPGNFSNSATVNSGLAIVMLEDWNDRSRTIFDVAKSIMPLLNDYIGVKIFPIMPSGLSQGANTQEVEFVIGGPTYDTLAEWRDMLLNAVKDYEGLSGIDTDYKETKPQIVVKVNRLRAAELGVSVQIIGSALETLLASKRVTTFPERGEEYDVILEADAHSFNSPEDIALIEVRSESGAMIPLGNLVTLEEVAISPTLNRFNRTRAVTLSANINEGYTLGEVLNYLETTAREVLPEDARIDYKGQSLEFKQSGQNELFIFGMALVIVFLVLAAQFESFLHPFTIMLSVPLALFGGLAALWALGLSLNIYSQIGMIMLVGLAAKNGILIVEFTNQLRAEGMALDEALRKASALRLRPILMTSITTVMGAVPLLLASGAGAESRYVLGAVIVGGVVFSTLFTLFVVPVAYGIIGRYSKVSNEVEQRLTEQLEQDR